MARTTRQVWAERVHQWQRSGLTAPQFAASEGINVSTLRWWAWRIRMPASRSLPSFIEVAVPAQPDVAGIEIVLPDGIRVQVAGAFDATVLRRVISTLREP